MQTGADGFSPAGYELCRKCGRPFVEGTRPSGRCLPCDGTVAEQAKATVVVRIDGVDVERGPVPKRPRRHKRKPRTAAQKQWARARSLAYRRLAALHPEDYVALLEAARSEVAAGDADVPTSDVG